MRTVQAYVEDPWDVSSYRTKLQTLYRVMHGQKKRSKVDAADVQDYSQWLIPRIEEIYRYMKQKYTNILVLSSMMLPVVSVLRMQLGLENPTTAKWRKEATELRHCATQEIAHNIQDEHFKTYQEICSRRDAIKRTFDKDPVHVLNYWQWFALCLYTMQPPLRADWACFSIIETIDFAGPTGNYLILAPDKASILIREDKVSKRKGGAQISITPELHTVLLESLSRFPRSVVVPHLYKPSKNAKDLSYSPDKQISKVNLSKLLAQAMASPGNNIPWTRPIQRLRAAHSTHVLSSHASYHTIKEVADAQRHSVPTMLCFYNAVQPSCSQEDSSTSATAPCSQEEKIASLIHNSGLSDGDTIIMTVRQSQGQKNPTWTLFCSNPELKACAEQGFIIIQDSYSSMGGP